jgi:uncharacterized protein
VTHQAGDVIDGRVPLDSGDGGPGAAVRVLLAGDSVARGLAPTLKAALDDGGGSDVRFLLMPVVRPEPLVRLSWEGPMRAFDPQVVVLSVGVWETGRILIEAGSLDDPAWRDRYEADVLDPWVRFLTDQGARLLWVGNPAVGDPEVTERLLAYNELLAALPGRWPQVAYVSSAVALNGVDDAQFREVVIGPDGTPVRSRQVDGLHLCVEGALRLAAVIAEALDGLVPTRPGWERGAWREDAEAFPPERCPPVA